MSQITPDGVSTSDTGLFLDTAKKAIEHRLHEVLPDSSNLSTVLVEAMRYAVMNGGKRLRGRLVCATSHAFGQEIISALDCAAAIELIHAYSLVHDDLPAMDDAELRRGKPSCHRVYGDDIAVLVGDALQPLAFELVVSDKHLSPESKIQVVLELAKASGFNGMVGGQAWDIRLIEHESLNRSQIRRLQAAKTGALFVASITMGYLSANRSVDDPEFEKIQQFGTLLGEAFQVVDDILDLTQTEDELGKPSLQDESQGKSTLPLLVGVDVAREHAEHLLNQSLAILESMGMAESPLAMLAHQCVERTN